MDTPKEKLCTRCNLTKPEKSFAKTHSTYKGKVTIYYQNICNTCKGRGYRLRNPDKEKERHADYRSSHKEEITTRANKRFHHREPSDKTFNICHALTTSMPLAAIIDEARKCDVLCMNCHQIRHYLV